MTGLEIWLIGQGVILGVKFIADIAVRLSKKTANSTDDIIAASFKSATGSISLFKKK